MSSRIVTAEIFDAFLKCKSKAYFKSSGQIGEPDELVNWRREVRQEFRRSCQLRYRSIFQDAFDASQPLPLDEVKSGKHHILFDCGIEAGQFQSRIDAVEKVTRLSRMKYRGYIPIRFVPNEKLSRHDKLLLAFDAYTLSLALGTTPTIGKRFSKYNTNTVVVRNFPSLAELALGVNLPWNERPPLVVYVGSMAPERGFREAMAAISLLPPDLNARLAFAGPLTSRLREEIGRLAGSDRTDLLGLLGRGEVASLLGRARVGLVPLHRMPNFVNALPVKLFEYMSAGVPVVASDFPLWRQIIEDAGCGLLVDPRDSNGIARGIEYLLTHPEEAQQMGARGREAIQRSYNWKTEEQQLLALYNSPCCRPKRPDCGQSRAA